LTDNNKILIDYQKYLIENTSKNIYYRVIPGILIILFFMYNDYFIIHSVKSFFIRFLVLIPLFLTLFTKLFFNDKKAYIFNIYMFSISVLPIMMYAKIIVHYNTPQQLFLSIMGTILIIFITSLELRLKIKYLIIVFFVPFLSFSIFLFISINSSYFTYRILLNIFPIIIIGFISNNLLNSLLFNNFKSSFLLKKEKQVVEEQNEELKVLNDTKNRFFSIISHDLKNPFNIIMGFSEVLKDGYNSYSDKERLHYITEINNSSKVVYGLLDNLLQWSSIQLNGITLKKEEVNIKSLINEIISTQELNAKEKKIIIKNIVDEGVIINIDKQSVYTIITNLISNAIKFSFEESEIIVSTIVKDNQITFSVKDFGVGIEKNVADKLFKIHKNHSTLGTKKEKGNGLGLVLSKEITEQNNGKIWINSEANKGSTFYVSFPV